MLLQKTVEHDARVRREARALAGAGHDLTIAHLPAEPGGPSVEQDGYRLSSASPRPWVRRQLPAGLYRLAAVRNLIAAARRDSPDVVHAHDVAMLVPGFIAARLAGARLVYDSHELATGVPYRSRAWGWLVAIIERLLVRRCDQVITVSDGIAARLQERYGLERPVTVVRNVADPPSSDTGGEPRLDLRSTLGLGDRPLVLHQGAIAQDRGCENLVAAISMVEADLVFLGAEGAQAERLRASVDRAGTGDRIHFLPPAPLEQLLAITAQADVGVSLLEDTCENHRLALPNKVFDYVAAGVPVVVSALPELERLVAAHGIGWTVDPSDPASVAAGLRVALEARGDEGLRRRLAEAGAGLSWRSEKQALLELYSRLERRPG